VCPKKVSTLARATSANSSRRSKETSRPAGPIVRSSHIDSAPEPTPASTTVAPGKMSAEARICAASFGYTMAAPRGIDMTKSRSSGRKARYSWPPELVTTEPSG
jgi:hypothetical protein